MKEAMMTLTITKQFLLKLGGAIAITLVGWLIFSWLFTSPFTIVGRPATDDLENLIDTAIVKNATDFYLWYKANILIQTGIILTSVLATILASVSNEKFSLTIKYSLVFLTAISTVFASIQSVFHIRENLHAFIDVNTRLSNLEAQYSLDKSLMPQTKKRLRRYGLKQRRFTTKLPKFAGGHMP